MIPEELDHITEEIWIQNLESFLNNASTCEETGDLADADDKSGSDGRAQVYIYIIHINYMFPSLDKEKLGQKLSIRT